MLGEKSNIFYLKFEKDYFYEGDILTCGKNVKLLVLEDPHKKWYKQLLEFITFRLYKAPTQYKCKVIE